MPSILRLACLLLMSMSAAVQAQQWQTTSERDGIRVESRRVPGERFHELRLSTSLRVAPTTRPGRGAKIRPSGSTKRRTKSSDSFSW